MANNYLAHGYLKDLKAAFPSLEKLKAILPNLFGGAEEVSGCAESLGVNWFNQTAGERPRTWNG